MDKLEFEAALDKLEAIVAELEAGNLSLEEALEKFKTAMRLKELCTAKLADAEAQIEEYVMDEESEEG